MSGRDASEPLCRLYLPGPPSSSDERGLDEGELAAFESRLGKALAAGVDIACLRLSVAGLDDRAARGLLTRIAARVQPHGIALLVEDRPDLVAATGIDGVHLTAIPAKPERLRRELGPDRILGIACGLSRHEAMVAGEAEADYVSFAGEAEGLVDLASWWAALMTVPCVAEGAASPDQARRLAAAGADFILPAASLWAAEDPAPALQALAAAIRQQA